MVTLYNTRGGIFSSSGNEFFSAKKKSVKWHRLWNSLFHTSNIISLRLGLKYLKYLQYLKGECMNQKAKPHKQSLALGGQNGIWVFGYMPLRFGGVWQQRLNVNSFILW